MGRQPLPVTRRLVSPVSVWLVTLVLYSQSNEAASAANEQSLNDNFFFDGFTEYAARQALIASPRAQVRGIRVSKLLAWVASGVAIAAVAWAIGKCARYLISSSLRGSKLRRLAEDAALLGAEACGGDSEEDVMDLLVRALDKRVEKLLILHNTYHVGLFSDSKIVEVLGHSRDKCLEILKCVGEFAEASGTGFSPRSGKLVRRSLKYILEVTKTMEEFSGETMRPESHWRWVEDEAWTRTEAADSGTASEGRTSPPAEATLTKIPGVSVTWLLLAPGTSRKIHEILEARVKKDLVSLSERMKDLRNPIKRLVGAKKKVLNSLAASERSLEALRYFHARYAGPVVEFPRSEAELYQGQIEEVKEALRARGIYVGGSDEGLE